MDKKAKILATLGPAIFKKNIINNLIRSGVDGFRINFSHNLSGINKVVKIIRDCEKLNTNFPSSIKILLLFFIFLKISG